MTQENRHPSIDAFNYCPSCGHSSVSSDQVKKIFCPKCSFTFYLNPASAVAIIIENQNGEILLTQRALAPQKGKLDLPGGFVDPFESLEDATRREVMEELSLKIESLDFFLSQPNIYEYKGVTYQTVDAVFHTKVSSVGTIKLSDEIQSIQWIKPSEIDFNELGFSSIKNAINEFINVSSKS